MIEINSSTSLNVVFKHHAKVGVGLRVVYDKAGTGSNKLARDPTRLNRKILCRRHVFVNDAGIAKRTTSNSKQEIATIVNNEVSQHLGLVFFELPTCCFKT